MRSGGWRTEIISPANKQYKIALRAFHCRGEPCGLFQGLKPVPIALRAFQMVSRMEAEEKKRATFPRGEVGPSTAKPEGYRPPRVPLSGNCRVHHNGFKGER